MIANTDTQYYLSMTSHVYRLMPWILKPSEISTIHGANEHLSIENLKSTINFYMNIITKAEIISDVSKRANKKL